MWLSIDEYLENLNLSASLLTYSWAMKVDEDQLMEYNPVIAAIYNKSPHKTSNLTKRYYPEITSKKACGCPRWPLCF